MIAAIRQLIARRAHRRALAARARCCGGRCTNADNARALAQLAPLPMPFRRQPHAPEGS